MSKTLYGIPVDEAVVDYQVMPNQPPMMPQQNYEAANAELVNMCKMLMTIVVKQDKRFNDMMNMHNAQMNAMANQHNAEMNSMMNCMRQQAQQFQRSERYHYDRERERDQQIYDLQCDIRRLNNRGVFGCLGDQIDKLF